MQISGASLADAGLASGRHASAMALNYTTRPHGDVESLGNMALGEVSPALRRGAVPQPSLCQLKAKVAATFPSKPSGKFMNVMSAAVPCR